MTQSSHSEPGSGHSERSEESPEESRQGNQRVKSDDIELKAKTNIPMTKNLQKGGRRKNYRRNWMCENDPVADYAKISVFKVNFLIQ